MLNKLRIHAPVGTQFFRKKYLIIFLLLFSPATVLANGGSPMLTGILLHLLIGNVFIGFIEGFFLRIKYGIKLNYLIIILANYVSMFLGYFFIVPFLTQSMGLGNYLEGWYHPVEFWIALMITFVASVLIEWPFFRWALKHRADNSPRTSFKYTTYAQCVSYGFIVAYYLFVILSHFGWDWSAHKEMMKSDLINLSAHAYTYRIRPLEKGGGGGSYEGYKIPQTLAEDEYGISTVAAVYRDSLILQGKSKKTDGTMTVKIGPDGRLGSWEYTGSFK